MGQSSSSSGLNCCRQEGLFHNTSELAFHNRYLQEHCQEDDQNSPRNFDTHGLSSASRLGMRPGSWRPMDDGQAQGLWCVRDNSACVADEQEEGGVIVDADGGNLESLSYMPVRFDEGTTIDAERSQARYSKIVVHSARARTQRRTRAWEEWLRGAMAGRKVTLVGFTSDSYSERSKVPAIYSLDDELARLLLRPAQADAADAACHRAAQDWHIPIYVDNIQVICPATDFVFFFDKSDTNLDDAEKARAVLLQYTEDDEKKRVCFLEESELEKDRFIQALTALWLEKRNDHSMWF